MNMMKWLFQLCHAHDRWTFGNQLRSCFNKSSWPASLPWTYAKENGALGLIGQTLWNLSFQWSTHFARKTELDKDLDRLRLWIWWFHDWLSWWGTWRTMSKIWQVFTEKDPIKSSRKMANQPSKANTGIQLKKLKRDELNIFKEITSRHFRTAWIVTNLLDYYQDFYDAFGNQADFMIATLNFHYLNIWQNDQKNSGKN